MHLGQLMVSFRFNKYYKSKWELQFKLCELMVAFDVEPEKQHFLGSKKGKGFYFC